MSHSFYLFLLYLTAAVTLLSCCELLLIKKKKKKVCSLSSSFVSEVLSLFHRMVQMAQAHFFFMLTSPSDTAGFGYLALTSIVTASCGCFSEKVLPLLPHKNTL